MGLLDSNLYSQQKKYIPKNEFLSQASLLKNQEELEQYTNAVIANNNEVLGAELKAKDPNAYKAWEDYSNYNPSGLNLEQFQEARNNPTKPKSVDIANPLGIAGVLLDKAGLVPDSVKYGLDMSRNRIEGFLKDGYNFLTGNENYQNPHYKEIEKIRVASKYQPNHTTTDRVMQSLVNYATDPIDLATTFVAPANIVKVASVAKGAQYYAPIVKNALYAGVGGGLNSAINPNNYNETKGDVVADIGFNTAIGGVLGGVGAGLTNRIFNGKWVAPKSDVMLSDSTPATNIANNAIESNANNVSSNLTTTTNPIYQAILDKQARDLGLNPINTNNTAETIIEPNITNPTNKPFGLMEYYQSLPENNATYRNIVDSKINATNPANESFGMLDMARMQDEINNNIRTNANGTNANLATNMPNNTNNLPKQVMGDSFVMGEAGRIQHYSDMPINQTMKNNLGVDFDSIKADFTQLQNTHPELFSNTNAVAKLMQNIKDNPEYFFKNNRLDMQLVGKFLGDNRFAEMGVVTQGNNAGKVGHILETSKGDKRIRSLIKREDKNPLAEPATLNTLSNRTDGRNGANALSKDLSNSTPITPKESLKAEDNLSFESYVKSKGMEIKNLTAKELIKEHKAYKAQVRANNKANTPQPQQEEVFQSAEAKPYNQKAIENLLDNINNLEKKSKRTNVENQILKGLKERLVYEVNNNPKLKEVIENYKNDTDTLQTKFNALKSHPRYEELLSIQENVLAKDLGKKYQPNTYTQKVIHTDNGREIVSTRIQSGEPNYYYDMSLSKADVSNLRKGKITEELLSKLEKDLGNLDNNPRYSNEALPKREQELYNDYSKYLKESYDRGEEPVSLEDYKEGWELFNGKLSKIRFRNPKVQQEHQNHLKEIIQKVNDKTESSLSLKNATQLFKSINKDKENDLLFDRIIESAKQLGVKVEIKNKNKGISTNETGSYDIYKNLATIFNNFENKIHQSEDLLHELIHSTTARAFRASPDLLTPLQKEGIAELKAIYSKAIEGNKKLGNEKLPYGLRSLDEFVAELSNPEFRNILKKNQSVFDKIKEAISKIVLGIKNAFRIKSKIYESNQYTRAKNALYKILDNYNPNFTKQWDSKKIQETLENLKSQKELRGIYNVTYNGKNATLIKQDIEKVDNAIRYQLGSRIKGGKHIRISHTMDKTQEGYLTPQEIINMGRNIREYIKEYKEPFIDRNGARIYEWFDNVGNRFRVVTNDIKGKGNSHLPQLSKPLNDEIITFYSDRNLKLGKTFEFKNQAVKQAYDEKFGILKKIREDRENKANADFLARQDLTRNFGFKYDEGINARYAYLKEQKAKYLKGFVDKISQKFVNNVWYSPIVNKVLGTQAYRNKPFLNALENHKREISKLGNNLSELSLMLNKAFTQEQLQKLAKYHIGELDEKAISPELKAFADTQREYIKQAGQKLVEYGLLDEKTFKEMGSTYLMREYASKIDKNIITRYFKSQKDVGIQGSKHRGETKVVLQSTYEKMKEAGEIGKFIEGKWEMYDSYNGKIHLRRDWSREQRDKWGQIDNYAYNLPRTLDKIYRDIYSYQFLANLSKDSNLVLNKKGLVEAPQGYASLEGKKWGALSRFYVRKEIADSLKSEFLAIDDELNKYIRAWSSAVTFWKKGKTSYNPTTHFNNTISNLNLLMINGEFGAVKDYLKNISNFGGILREYNKFKEARTIIENNLISKASKEQIAIYNKYKNDNNMKLLKELDDYGIFNRSNLNAVTEQIYKETKVDFKADNKAVGVLKGIDEKLSGIYNAEDALARYVLVKSYLKEGYSLDNAVAIANNILPDYTKPIPAWLRRADNWGLMPFIRWTYYSTPTLLKSINPLQKNAKGEYAPIKKLFGMAVMYGIYEGLNQALTNGDMPNGYYGSELPIFRIGNDVQTIRIKSMIPHLGLLEFASLGNIKGNIIPEFFVKLATNGIPQQLFQQALNYNLAMNRPYTRREGAKGAMDRGVELFNFAMPVPFGKGANALVNSIEQDKNRRSKIYNERSSLESLLSTLLVNTKSYNINELRKKLKQED